MDWHIIMQQLLNGLVLGMIYALIAIGYTMVYGIIGMINFAHGDITMVAAYLTTIFIALLSAAGLHPVIPLLFTTLLLTCLFTAFYGWLIERVAYRPLRHASRLAALISAIGMSFVLQNFIRISQGSGHQGVPDLITGALRLGSGTMFVQISNVQVVIIISALTLLSLLLLLVHRTPLGRSMRATQQDATMSAILGIHTNRVIASVFALGAMMAALAGFLLSLNYGTFDFNLGFLLGIKAFTAAVLGGIGSLAGAVLGGVVLGLSESLFSGFVNTDYKDVFAFSLLVLVLIFRPSGFLGQPEVEKV